MINDHGANKSKEGIMRDREWKSLMSSNPPIDELVWLSFPPFDWACIGKCMIGDHNIATRYPPMAWVENVDGIHVGATHWRAIDKGADFKSNHGYCGLAGKS